MEFTPLLPKEEKWGTDEFEAIFPSLRLIFERQRDCKTTWFFRLDDQIKDFFGQPDYLIQKYEKEIQSLYQDGHEIGWHPHFFIYTGGKWRQNKEVIDLMEELVRHAPLAQSYGFRSVRMGWGHHTNETMRLLSDLGFAVDSSAIPRPQYAWDETYKDWVSTPVTPYFPSTSDYRVPGEPALPILEIPMSVTHIEAPYDTERVLRYINLAYHPERLKRPLEHWMKRYPHMITITHLDELFPREKAHGLLAFDLNALEQNLKAIQEMAEKRKTTVSFLTLREFAESYEGNHV